MLLGIATGLSLAALVAAVAVLSHTFDQTALRLVGTGLGFSVFSALGAAGAPARGRQGLYALGTLTTASAGLGFVLLILAVWINPETRAWQVFGFVAVITLAGCHACLVLSARRVSDPTLVANLTVISVVAASADAVLVLVAISGRFRHVSGGELRFAALLNIAMLLSTALPPLLRRARHTHDPVNTRRELSAALGNGQPDELLAIARRLEHLIPEAGDLAARIEREAIRLREIASLDTASAPFSQRAPSTQRTVPDRRWQ
jgi:hypothetical protein